MPRVPVALNGWAQVPDEHGGPPRVARLINARMDSPNRIAKTPGTVPIPIAQNTGANLRAPLAYGVTADGTSIVVSKEYKTGITGAPVYSLESDTWQRQALENSQTMEIDEAPRVDLIFSDVLYTYGQPGVANLGDGDFLVFADASQLEFGPGGTGYSSEVHWALVSGADLQVKARGAVVYGIPNASGGPRYPVAAGPYVVMWYGVSNLGIYQFNRATMQLELMLACPFFLLTYLPGMQIDAAWDPVQNRLLVMGPNTEYFWVNVSSWAVVHTGAFTASAVLGTVGVGISSYVVTGDTYIVWRQGTNNWYRAVYQITDAGLTLGAAAAILYSSAIALPATQPWQAKVTAWGNSTSFWGRGALVVIYDLPYSGGSQSLQGVLLHLLPTGTPLARNIAGFDFFGAVPAAKPVVQLCESETGIEVVKGRCWSYMTSGRDMRSAVNLAESTRLFTCAHHLVDENYPRMIGMVFRGADPAPVPVESLLTGANATITATFAGKSGWLTAMLSMRDAATTTHTKVYLVSQVDGGSLLTPASNTLPDVLQTANANGVTLLASAVPSQYGTKCEMSGSQYTPRKPIVSTNGVGAVPAGTYSYVCVRKWYDSKGRITRSAVSEPTSITSGAAGSFDVRITDDPWENRQINSTQSSGYSDFLPGTVTEIYRTVASGTVYYLVTPNGLPTPGTQLLGSLYNDTNLDATIRANETLYTQGARGGNSGLLDWWGCPPCRCLWSGGTRVICGGLENAKRVQWSNLFFSGESITCPQNAAFWAELPEEVTAVAAIDQSWLVFSLNSVWMFNGQGPDAFGSGTFGDPLLISSGIGAKSWRSLVDTPEGVMFQAADAQIYLVQRGTLQVLPKSQDIRDSIGCAPTGENAATAGHGDTSDPTYWVVGATYDRFMREAWFCDNRSRCWVYQVDFGAWREEVATAEVGKYGIFAGTIKTSTYEGPVFIRIDGTTPTGLRIVRRSESNTYIDRLGYPRYMGIHTNDIELVHGRIKRVWVKVHPELDEAGPAIVSANLSFWFDGKRNNQTPDEVRSYTYDAAATVTRFMDEEFCPARQKCNQVRVAWVDAAAVAGSNIANYVIGIDLELEQSPKGRGSIRYATGTNRGT